MSDFTIDIVGQAPLLMHSARLSDPLDDASKALSKVTSKRSKTDDDHAEVSRLEHAGGLYIDNQLGPYVPGANIERCLFDAATKFKLGKALRSALLIPEEVNPLAYDGPRTVAGLWEDKQFVHRASVKVGMSRVVRTRPVFPRWTLSVSGELDTDVVDRDEFEQIAEIAGRLIGLGDWRPRFGRFDGKVQFT